MTDSYDSPWKDILERYFPEFLAFFFPHIHPEVDWSRGYESLDTELAQIVRDAELGKRLADKLFRVRRRDGQPCLVLIHVEVQGEPDADFAQRMYVYNYRLFDRYGVPVVSLAVLGDDNPNWRPKAYYHDLWGCRAGLSFPVAKLADYTSRWEALEADPNPFAVVVMTHLRTRATRGDPQGRLDTKLALVRHLYRRGFGREDILELFRFLDWLLALPEELAQRFRVELEAFEASMSTPYITSIERMGIQKGKSQQAHRSLLTILQVRFGDPPTELRRRIEAIEDLSELERLLREAVTAPSLEAFRATLPSGPNPQSDDNLR